jgi:transcriptional regulator with XRE-family HTH domain
LARADHETSRLHREYVQLVVDRMGKAPTRIAKELGIAPSTLTRLLKSETPTATLHARTLRKLQDYSGIPPLFGTDASAPAPRGFAEDAVPFDAKSADPAVSAAIKALIGWRKAADPWTIRTRALERIGYLPGDIVIVDLGRRPEAGDAVCAQVYDWRRAAAETVMRLYEPPYLVAASLDEGLRRPLVVDNEQVIIKGVVLPHRLRPGAPIG